MAVSKTLFESTPKRRLMIDWIVNPQSNTQTTDPAITTVTISLPYPSNGFSYFIGSNHIRNNGNQFICDIYVNQTNFAITGKLYNAGTILFFKGISLTGFACAKGFYLDEVK
jgi:hypothetical protein